jgi:hypothetical protein
MVGSNDRVWDRNQVPGGKKEHNSRHFIKESRPSCEVNEGRSNNRMAKEMRRNI